jgi:hypothetical protein
MLLSADPILFCLAHKKRANRSFETLAAHHQSAVIELRHISIAIRLG